MLKLKHNLPIWVENRLVVKYGYHVVKREFQDYVLFAKLSGTAQPKDTVTYNIPSTLTAAQEDELIKRCDNIVDHFMDPYNHIMSVRTRLHNMMQTLPSMREQQFVLEYMDENFPLEGNA